MSAQIRVGRVLPMTTAMRCSMGTLVGMAGISPTEAGREVEAGCRMTASLTRESTFDEY
jgi:hypothetical protein